MMEILDCEQRSEAWFRARMGIVTASNFQTIMVPIGPKGGVPEGRTTLLRTLAGEIITGQPAESYSNPDMVRGQVMEAEARDFYAFTTDEEVKRVGFVRNGKAGCSPDSLVGADGVLEIKTAQPNVLIEIMEKDEFPSKHKAQCQGALWVCEREWVDISIYWPKMPPFIKRATRDESYIAKLSAEVDRFNAELAALVERIRGLGQPMPADTLIAEISALTGMEGCFHFAVTFEGRVAKCPPEDQPRVREAWETQQRKLMTAANAS